MAEYIDLNEAIIDFGFEWDDIAPTRDEFINFLKSRKRANVKEIIYAHWEKADGMGYYRCSHCKTVDDKYYQPEYCPHCGAKMSRGYRMTNREWLLNQPKEQIITNTSKPCPHPHCPDILKSCTECWIDWLDEEHKESDEPEN